MFEAHRHPFEGRARIELARCYQSQEPHAEYERQLEHAERLCDAMLEQHHPDEAALVKGDLTLTKLWALEDRARQGVPDGWKECALLAEQLSRLARTAPTDRFVLEQDIHAGLAMAMSGDEATCATGLDRLDGAARRALATDNRKLAISARFALAEVTCNRDEPKALAAWTEGSQLLESIWSAALTRWKERLAVHLKAPPSFRIDADVTFKKAVKKSLLVATCSIR